MRADSTVAICECSHDVGKHGINIPEEISGEYRVNGCFEKDCKCQKFKFKEKE